MQINVMLVEEHILIREGIKLLFKYDSEINIIDEASNVDECLERISFSLPDLILLDIYMPKKNGIEVLKQIRKNKFDVKILIFTSHTEINFIIEAYDNNVDGYILKDTDSIELKKIIKQVYNGKKYIQPSLMPILNSTLVKRDVQKEKLSLLTKREVEVLKSVASGLFNKEIAIELNISERTVKNHMSNIFKKIDVNDRTQAAVFAIKNNLIDIY